MAKREPKFWEVSSYIRAKSTCGSRAPLQCSLVYLADSNCLTLNPKTVRQIQKKKKKPLTSYDTMLRRYRFRSVGHNEEISYSRTPISRLYSPTKLPFSLTVEDRLSSRNMSFQSYSCSSRHLCATSRSTTCDSRLTSPMQNISPVAIKSETDASSSTYSSSYDMKALALMHVRRSIRSRNSSRASSVCSERGSTRSPKQLRSILGRAIRTVLTVVKMCLRIRHYVSKPETLKELSYYSNQHEYRTEALVFNKSHYCKSSSFGVPLWARIIMETDPLNRSPSDIQRLCVLLRRLKKFREWFTGERQIEFCRHCQFTRIDQRRVIARVGDKGHFCYMVFSGSLFVNIQEKDEITGKHCYKTKTILTEGNLFGDVSIILNQPHDVTVVTRVTTELLTLDMNACMKIVPAETTRELEVVMDHIRQSNFLTDWTIDALQKLAKFCKLVKYTHNVVIERDTLESDYIYMIIAGYVEVITGLDELQYSTSLPVTPTPITDSHSIDPFCESALYERCKSANQCSNYRPVSPYPLKTVSFSLELLEPYSICDLRSLLHPSSSVFAPHHLSLVSHCATVVRIPKLKLQTIPPDRCWRNLLLQAKDTPRYPSDLVLMKIYEEHLQWCVFKSNVVKHTLDVKNGQSIAYKPPRMKGASGWVNSAKPSFHDLEYSYEQCLGSDVPLYKHTRDNLVHSGPCLIMYKPIVNKYDYVHRYYRQQ